MESLVLCDAAIADQCLNAPKFRGQNVTGGLSVTRSHFERLYFLHPKALKSQFRMARESFDDLYERCEPFSKRHRSAPDPKPADFRYRFNFTLNIMGFGVASLRKEVILA